MKLLCLTLFNFRQFEGQTPRLEFAQSAGRNVTLIYGANGAGKTTLLNALTWLFYGKFTDAFGEPDQLVNRRAIAAAKPGDFVTCWAEITFEHNKDKYRLRRTRVVQRGDNPHEWAISRDDEVTLDMSGPDGRWTVVKSPDIPDVIGRILPEQLHLYFFFDGERIERLQRPDKRTEVVSAITILIGEEIFNRSINHLREVAKRLGSDLKASGDNAIVDLINKKEEIEGNIEHLERSLSQHQKNLDGYLKQKSAIEEAMRKLEAIEAVQQQRDQLVEEEENLEQALQTSRNTLADLVSSKGYLIFLRTAGEIYRTEVDSLKDRGELPSAIKAPFVRKLLSSGQCICGRSLVPGEDSYLTVELWMKRSGLSEIEEKAFRIMAEVNRLDHDTSTFFDQIYREKERWQYNYNRLSRVQESLDKIRESLKGSPEENVRDLQKQLDDVEQRIEDERSALYNDKRELERLRGESQSIDKEIQKLETKTAQQQLAKRRIAVCQETIDVLTKIRNLLRIHFRLDLQERINRIFANMSFKPYAVVLGDDYTLTLLDSPGGVAVGPSTGERQILSLSFIGAVIEQARTFTARRDRLPGPDSSTFPVVMDSPFGNLDPLYRRQVATSMPMLADQVVILASRTQWEGEVEKAIEPRVGKEYVLSYFTPKPDAGEDAILRHGRKYDLVKRSSDDFERTEIIEVVGTDG